MRIFAKTAFLTSILLVSAISAVRAADYSQNFDSWATHTTVGNYSEQGWATTNVLIRGGGFPWVTARSLTNSCYLYNEPNASIYTPLLTNTVGNISFYHQSKDRTGPGTYWQVGVVESSLSSSGPWIENGRFTNPAIAIAWDPATIPVNSFSNTYLRIRKLSDNGGSAQYLCIDDISISTIPPLLSYINITNSPAAPSIGVDTTVSMSIAPLATGVSNFTATVYYSTDEGASYIPLAMNKSGGTNFSRLIPGQPSPVVVRYYFVTDYEASGQTPPSDYYPSDAPASTFSYAHYLVNGDDRVEDFDDWALYTAVGNYSNQFWNVYDSLVRGTGFGWFPGLSPPYCALLANLSSGYDPSIQSPFLAEVGTIYFAHRSKLTPGVPQIVTVETSPNFTGPWTTNSWHTNLATDVAWYTNFSKIAEANVFVRIHKVDDGNVGSQMLAIDDIIISYPPADVIITNVTRSTLGYMYITNEVIISCDIITASTNIPAGNFQPKLCYRSSSSQPWTTNSMTHVSGSNYTATVPSLGAKGQIDYFIRCDFDGYYFEHAGNSEKLSPAFSPDAPETEYAPDTYYSYTVRPFRSDFDYLTVTSTAGNVTMYLDSDYTWQGQIDMTINQKAALTFGILGFGEYTNGSPVYSSLTNHWGDNDHINGSAIPDSGIAEVNGTPININGPFVSPVIISLNTKNRSYLMVRGYYQDFNNWSSADSDFYEFTVYGIGTSTFTNQFEDFPLSITDYTTPTNGSSAFFDDWPQPSTWWSAPTQVPDKWWMIQHGIILNQRGDGFYTNKVLALRNVPDQGEIYQTAYILPDGLGHIDFKYRCAQLDDYYAVCNSLGADWQNVAIDVNVTFNSLENDARFSILPSYKDFGGGVKKFYETRFWQELGTKDGNNSDIDFYYSIGGGATNLWTHYDLDNNRGIEAYSLFTAMITSNNSKRVVLQSYWNNGYYKKNNLLAGYEAFNGSSFAILPQNADISINWVKVRPYIGQFFDNTQPNGLTTNEWVSYMANSNTNNLGTVLTNVNSYIRTRSLCFTPHWLKVRVQTGDPTGFSIDVNASASPSSGYALVTTLTSSVPANVTLTITNLPAYANYIRFDQNKAYATTVDDIQIYGITNYFEDFTTKASTNRWFLDTRGGWTLNTNNGGSLRHPGYGGPPIGFEVQIAPTNAFNQPATPWTTIYSATVTNYQYQFKSINIDALDPYRNHAHPTFTRIRHSTGAGYLLLDEINTSSWHGDKYKNSGGWKATEAWIQEEPSGNTYIELHRDRSYTNAWQYVQSAISTSGISAVTFSYKVTNAPVSFGVFTVLTNNMADDSAYVLKDSFTITANSTTWSNKSVSINLTGPRVIRIANTSVTDKATLMIDNLMISDYKGVVDSTWVGNNTLISYNQDSKEFEPTFQPETAVRTAYLNNDASADVKSPPIAPATAYIESPRSGTGIGAISFWYRNYNDSGSPPGTIEFYVATNRAATLGQWEYIGSLTGITNTQYEFFSQNFYQTDYNFLRIVNGTNGIADGRVCIDNILIKEPMGATLFMTNLTTIPAVPLYSTKTRLSVEINKTLFNPSNINMTAYYKLGTDNWGNWATNEADGYFAMTNVNGTGSVYTSVGRIDEQSIDSVVQYFVHSTFMGQFSNSPITFKGYKVPSWYYPIDLNTNYAKNIPYYFSFSCTTGAVWINEYRIWDDASGLKIKQFVELAGRAGIDIGNWELGINNQWGGHRYTSNTIIPNGTLLTKNETNGFAFYVIGDSSVPERDVLSTNTILQMDQIVLYRSMGAYADISYDKDHEQDSDGFATMSLMGSGSQGSDFTWTWYDSGAPAAPYDYTPGKVNTNQNLINAFGPNPFVTIDIIDTWVEGSQTWIVYDIIGTNYYLPPVPMYTTNITATGSWQNVSSFSYTNSMNTYTSWWTTINSSRAFHKISITNIYTP